MLSCISFRNFTGSELYVYELAKAFNKFYHDDPISQLADTELQDFRLMLCVNTAKVIRKSFSILGIAVPERM